MAKGRKTTNKVQETEIEEVKEQITEKVDVVVEDDTTEEVEEQVVQPEVKQEKEIFTMDITEFGVKFEDAEKFVKTAIKFYFENKDKKLFDDNQLESMKTLINSKSDNNAILEKIKRFENQIKMNQYVPKKTVVDFLKDLKQ